jgi:hypothetical protein
MNCSTNSFPRPGSIARLTFLIALTALPLVAEAQVPTDPYQKVSFKAAKVCVVAPSGEVTSLIRNGVELSVTEDWDCDGVPDAYDNCVAMPDRTQSDSDGNGIGDVCEAGVTIKAKVPLKNRPDAKVTARSKSTSSTKPKSRRSIAADKRSRSTAKKRRGR